MPKAPPKPALKISRELYDTVADLAALRGISITAAADEVVEAGLAQHMDAIRRFRALRARTKPAE